ncbi:glycosyltransferase family 4 protein [Novosphingobium aerophilum]|uniref:glycosyltransferase family 4 protein n=1 Tax=Novosphingobium TaxID=165696 RepID=UPI0006C884EC|nr:MULTISPECIES: glycosyltransferase family 4 protein [unclassified Novosphingobium]KPH64382.1 glycosyl transferase family 1 [Novosphingobium sp. ST904]TCM37378.1 glycosyltransferase involved in cell wall biosynthesis [Novosphingobium sp. ST904]WRT93663.1 glycosyltransferase family 4 protein [Novosphingobium sp. RL4]
MRILHLHSSFAAGGKELRAVRLMNLFGPRIAHAVVSAQPGAHGAAIVLDPALDVTFPEDFPGLQGRPAPARLWRIAKAMADFDLVLTYNWGAMDAVMAHGLFSGLLGLPPLVHHEDGFNEDEAAGLKPARNRYRRIALRRASALVVPSRRLEAIALSAWRQPRGRVRLITNGIDCDAYLDRPRPDVLPGIVKQPGERWVGTLAGLRPVKNLPRLVRAFAPLPEPWRLVILGEGPDRAAIEAEAARCGVSGRVHLPGFVADPSHAVGLFDVFALSSESEQFPISVVEAMAAALPVASPAVGDVADMVSVENRALVTPPGDEAALASTLLRLAGDERLRARLGAANRALARDRYDEAAMLSAYSRTYGEALGRERLI